MAWHGGREYRNRISIRGTGQLAGPLVAWVSLYCTNSRVVERSRKRENSLRDAVVARYAYVHLWPVCEHRAGPEPYLLSCWICRGRHFVLCRSVASARSAKARRRGAGAHGAVKSNAVV